MSVSNSICGLQNNRGLGIFSRAFRVAGVGLLLLSVTASLVRAQDPPKDPPKGKKNTLAEKPPKDAPVVARPILVFATDTRGGVSDAVADDIAAVIKSRLSLSKLYEPVTFSPAIPTVRLAISGQMLSASDVRNPYDNDAKLKKITGVTGNELVIVSSIDDYEFDSAKGQVNVVMSARLIDYSGAKAVVRSAAQSASSPENKTNEPELKVAAAVVRSLTDKLMTAILSPPKPSTPTK